MFSDWLTYFWPQIENPWMLHPGIFNLPWLFVAVQPLRLLGQWGALAALQVAALAILLVLGRRLRVSAWKMALVVFSPPFLFGLFLGQFDALFLAAYLLPSWAALPLALCKPQVALGAGLAALVRDRRAWMIAAILALSAWLLWSWPFACVSPASGGPTTARPGWNWAHAWPWVGLLLLPLALDERGRLYLSPFAFPYAGVQSLIGPLLACAAGLPTWAFLAVWAVFWLRWLVILR
jgi:hypothetical protein